MSCAVFTTSNRISLASNMLHYSVIDQRKRATAGGCLIPAIRSSPNLYRGSRKSKHGSLPVLSLRFTIHFSDL